MSTQRLTKTIADHAKYEGSGQAPFFIWDTEMRGFGLRVYSSGQKSFVITYRNYQNKQRFLVLGRYGVLTIQQARELARENLVLVDKGIDPLIEKRKHLIGETFKEFSVTYLERHAKREKKSWREDERMLNQYLLPTFGKHKLKDIKREMVSKFHHELGKKSIVVANRTVSILSKMYSLAEIWGAIDSAVSNPTKGIEKFEEKSRERWLTDEELQRLNLALMSEENLYARFAIVLFLFTGMRKSELLAAKWEHVKTYSGQTELHLPSTKSGTSQTVYLSQPALAILKQIPKQVGNDYIFAGNKPGQHLVNLDKPWQRVRKKAGIEDIWLHDLRRTFASRMVQSGVSLKIVQETLRHKSGASVHVYARLAGKEKQAAVEEQGSALEQTFMPLIGSFYGGK